jgi:hypothetical protein
MADPSPLDRPDSVLDALGPSPGSLLEMLRPEVDDAMLRGIAEADYGMFAEDNLRVLRHILDCGEVPPRLDPNADEVCQLVRWDETAAGDRRGHVRRAFACAVLLRAGPWPGSAVEAEADTIAQALDSVLVLGDEAVRAALRFLAWRALRLPADNPDRAFFALGVVVLAARLQAVGEADLERLGWWALAQAEGDGPLSPRFVYWGLRYAAWQRLAAALAEAAEGMRPGPTRDVLREAANLIVP